MGAKAAALTLPRRVEPGRRTEPVAIRLVLLALDAADPGRSWPGLPNLLDLLFACGLPCLVAGGARRSQELPWLDRGACAGRLPMRVGVDECHAGFPDPAPLLLAANRLAIPLRRTLVLASGPRAAQAGLAAGCPVIQVWPGLDRDVEGLLHLADRQSQELLTACLELLRSR